MTDPVTRSLSTSVEHPADSESSITKSPLEYSPEGQESYEAENDRVETKSPEKLTAEEDRDKPGASKEGAKPLPQPVQKSRSTRVLEIIQAHFSLVYTDNGKAYAVDASTPNPQTFRIGTVEFASAVRRLAFIHDSTLILTQDDLGEIAAHLEALADLTGSKAPVWSRVAQVKNGIEIDVGNETQTRLLVGPGGVRMQEKGSNTLFYRNPNDLPFALPADHGDLKPLLPYLNLEEKQKWLLIAWISYTLAHPKVPSTNYVILVLRSERGTGKSTMCNIILGALVGPTSAGIQAFPGSQRDLAIAAQSNHVVMYDNLRQLAPSQADMLCRCSTSAALSTRKLYTDGEQYTHNLHCALILNGIHSFIDQADLAQRCLTLELKPLEPSSRTTEAELRARFQEDLPVIFRGILDLIAQIQLHLPTVTAKYPERMLEFVHWLAAVEKVQGFSEGHLQKAYRANLVGAMQDSLQDNPLAEAVIDLARSKGSESWSGTPTDLLIELGKIAGPQMIKTPAWPQNEISLSKRLKKLTSMLSGAGVEVVIGRRSKERQIIVRYTGRSA